MGMDAVGSKLGGKKTSDKIKECSCETCSFLFNTGEELLSGLGKKHSGSARMGMKLYSTLVYCS